MKSCKNCEWLNKKMRCKNKSGNYFNAKMRKFDFCLRFKNDSKGIQTEIKS